MNMVGSLKWREAQFEIATTALLGGLTNLVVLAAGTSGVDVAYDSKVSNLFNTLGHAFGDSDFNTFGSEGPTRIAPGPLSELLG